MVYMNMELLSLHAIVSFLKHAVFTLSHLYQLIALGISLAFAKTASLFIKKILDGQLFHLSFLARHKKNIPALIFPALCCMTQWIIVAASREFHLGFWLNHTAAELMTGWVAAHSLSFFRMPPGLKKLAAFSIYSITILQMLGLLSQLLLIMESASISIGGLQVSVLSFLKGCIILFSLVWITSIISRWTRKRLKKINRLESSLQELLIKLIRITFLALSLLVALSSMGLNLSVFAVFGGAIGVGIGFGLQKVISNLICGIILLLDKSIKPGDVIALEQGRSYGIINRLGARCVSVRTRSGKEHLIPNEDFIIHKSENWSLTDSYLRLHIPIRADLNSDVNLVMKLLLDATKGVERILEDPSPGARLCSFSDSAIEFELRVWINDPDQGLSKVRSDVYINLWNLFKRHGITIPYPHRNIRLLSSPQETAEEESLPFPDFEKSTS